MEMTLSRFSPPLLWKHFEKITTIPHGSGNEAPLAEYILEFAKEKGWKTVQDKTGNLVVRVPASTGKESSPVTVVQGHLDMVCEKNSDVDHDFERDPLKLKIEGDILRAHGTSLGADNGIGVAAALAVAEEKEVIHGPLELLFTVEEETGLTGAVGLNPKLISGRRLLNLDSEETGSFTIGCAGGGDTVVSLPLNFTAAVPGKEFFTVSVGGLRGGHSGIDIHEGRGNANKILGRILWRALQGMKLVVGDIQGGSKRNAIPREARALIGVPKERTAAFKRGVKRESEAIRTELGKVEPGFRVEVKPADQVPSRVVHAKEGKKALNLLLAFPHGVESMSKDIEGLVETSTNLATVRMEKRNLVIGFCSRSSIASALQSMKDRIRAAAEIAGASVEEPQGYPGWKPNLESSLLKKAVEVHKEVFGKEPALKAIHAGLECGLIGEKIPGMDMISFGPKIEHPHSPEERLSIHSVESFWKLLTALLKALA